MPDYAALGLVAVLAVAALAGLVCRWRGMVASAAGRWRMWTALCLLSAALAVATTGMRSVAYARQALLPALEGRDVWLQGAIEGLPREATDHVRFRFRVTRAVILADPAAPQSTAVPVPVVVPAVLALSWYAPRQPGAQLPPVRVGAHWAFQVRLKAPHGAQNPGGFDYELWLWQQGIGATAYVRDGPRDSQPRLLPERDLAGLDRARQWVRERIRAQVGDAATAGLLAALVVGDQAAIGSADWDVFRVTGVAHLVSISGLHITMFAWFAGHLLRWLWRRSAGLCRGVPAPVAAAWGGWLLALAYALFSGWGLPAQRTCLMLWLLLALRSIGLRWPWPMVCLLAATAVLLVDPWAWLQPGFWLSFVAVSVLFATDASSAVAAARQPVWRAKLRAILREQWLLTLALAPLTVMWFGQVSVVGLLANGLAVPWITLVVTPLALLGVVWPLLWDLATQALGVWLVCLRAMADWPWAVLYWPALPWWVLLSSALGCGLLALPLPRPVHALALSMVLPGLLWQPPSPTPGHFRLTALDVGQGTAAVIQTARHSVLFDAGPRFGDTDAGQRVVLPYLQAQGLSPDIVVLSHQDADHAGGVPSVQRAFPGLPWFSSIALDHPLQHQNSANKQPAATRCQAGQRWSWDGVDFEIVHPTAMDYAYPLSPNARSCVLLVRSADGRQALLTGDMGKAQERALIARQPALRVDVLMVAHHGSASSSSADFLDSVRPSLAFIQSGYRNRYGHPHRDVRARLEARGIVVHETPRCGAFEWNSVHPAQTHCTRLAQRRYWHHAVP